MLLPPKIADGPVRKIALPEICVGFSNIGVSGIGHWENRDRRFMLLTHNYRRFAAQRRLKKHG